MGPVLSCARISWAGALLLALVVSAAPLEAEEPLCPPRATTALEDTAFAPSDTVVVARLLRVQEIRSPGGGRGRQLVRARVELVLKGNVNVDDEISIMVIGQRPTLNPEQPSVPYFRADKLDRYVLFLDRERGQYAFRLRTLFEGKGKLGAEKIAVSQAVGRLAAIPGEDEKARRTLAALFAMTKGTGKWTKGFAAREMNYLAAVRPDVFDTKTKARLRRLPTVVLTPEQRHWFKLLFKTLSIAGAMPAFPDAKDTESVEQDPWRATFLSAADEQQQQTMLTRLLRGDAAALERHGAWAWSEMEPEMRRWYARAAGQERVPAEAARQWAA